MSVYSYYKLLKTPRVLPPPLVLPAPPPLKSLSGLVRKTLCLPLVEDLQSSLCCRHPTVNHCSECRSHAVRAIDLTQLHATDNQTRHNLSRALHDRILGATHVQSAHPAQLLELLHGHEAFDAEGAEGSVVAGRGDDDGGVDGVGVHAGLVVVVHGDERPVGDDAGDLDGGGVGGRGVGARDQVFDAGGVEELDVGEGEDFGEEGGGEEGLRSG